MKTSSSKNQYEKGFSGLNNNLKKLTDHKKKVIAAILATLSLGYGAYLYNKNDKEDKDKNTLPETESFEALETMLANQTIEDFKRSDGKCYEKQEQWEDRYEGKDPLRDKKCSGAHNRKIVIEGFNRMIHSGDIVMIKHEIDEFNQHNNISIPYDVVFLALTESARSSNANSGIAGGYRQFTKSSAKSFGLDWEKRADPKASTKAALRHFKNNIDIVNAYVRKSGKHVSESDKWKYALWMFNGSPKMIKAGFGGMTKTTSDDGIISHYFDNIDKYKAQNPRIHADETKGYVPRILAIRSILKDKLEQGAFNDGKGITIIEEGNKKEQTQPKETNADKMFERYVELADNSSIEGQLKLLDSIRDEYVQEAESHKITQEYLNGALSVIKKEKESLINSDENEETGIETGVFISEGLDKAGNNEIYSYIIKKHGTSSILKRRFHEQYGINESALTVTNVKGKEYPDNYIFPKNKCVFIKKSIQKSFNFIKKSLDGKYNIYSYVVKKGGNSGGVIKNFIKHNQKAPDGIIVTDINGKPIKNTYFYPGTKVYVKVPIK